MVTDVDVLQIGFVLGHGGDALQMLDVAAGMVAIRKTTKVIVPAIESTVEFAQRCARQGIEVERSPWIRADQYASRQNLIDLIRLLRPYRHSLIHYHTGNVCLPRMLFLALRLLNMPPAFVTVQSPYETLTPGSHRARCWVNGVKRHFHTVFCPSRHSLQAQLRYGVPAERLRTVHNGIDVDRFRSGDASVPYQQLGLPEDARLIVFSSRIDPQKHPHDAFTAFANIACQFPDTHLIFVGRGSVEAELKARAAQSAFGNRVHFVGYQSNIPDWLAAATVWIFPTESENFSLAVLEALAAGCAIVSTNCPGNDEVLVPDHNALVTEVNDVAAQTHQLQRLLCDRSLRARLGLEAARTGAQHSIESVVRSYLKSYRDCAGNHVLFTPEQFNVPEVLRPREMSSSVASHQDSH